MAHSHTQDNLLRKTIVAYDGRRSAALEQYRVIRSNIKFLNGENVARSIVITSPSNGAGCSTTAVNLAVSMALRGDKVLLIDTNLRKPMLHSAFRIPNNSGLTSILMGSMTLEKAVYQTEVSGLDLLTSGPVQPYMDELLGNVGMRNLLSDAKQKYDCVLLDCPAILEAIDTALLANLADGVILVIESGRTKKEAAANAHKALKRANASVLGVVLN
ncbi:MAG: CpsD/CapB family tyrosine-protein kinase, partial [Gorillibacterium sp.]|nr:CpsD/CapB family tyrosine-protein kinase [Gorillibacterium sp.]